MFTYSSLVSYAQSQKVNVYLSTYAETAYNPSSKVIYINPEKWVTEEERFIMLLHELGHHLNGVDWLRDIYEDEAEAWNKGEQLCLKLYGDLPTNFHRVKEECLPTYLPVKGQTRAQLEPEAYQLKMDLKRLSERIMFLQNKMKSLSDPIKEEKEKPNWLLIGISSLIFLIGIPLIPHISNNQPEVTQQQVK